MISLQLPTAMVAKSGVGDSYRLEEWTTCPPQVEIVDSSNCVA